MTKPCPYPRFMTKPCPKRQKQRFLRHTSSKTQCLRDRFLKVPNPGIQKRVLKVINPLEGSNQKKPGEPPLSRVQPAGEGDDGGVGCRWWGGTGCWGTGVQGCRVLGSPGTGYRVPPCQYRVPQCPHSACTGSRSVPAVSQQSQQCLSSDSQCQTVILSARQ